MTGPRAIVRCAPTERYVIHAELKPGKAHEAERALETGPPFDPAAAGLTTHTAYVTDAGVYLVFEGEAARTTALQLARTHFTEVSRWQELVSGLPSSVDDVPPDARPVYHWDADASGS